MKNSTRFGSYFFASAVFHTVLVLSLYLATFLDLTVKIPDSAVEISLLSPEEIAKLQNVNLPPEPQMIVQSDSNEKINEQAKFLGEKNNSVDKQTKAKRAEDFNNTAKAGGKNQVAKTQQKEVNAKKSSPQLFDDNFDPYAALIKKDMAQELKKFSQGEMATGVGSSPTTNDHLVEIDESLITKLNTKEYKYYGYYHRMRLQLNQWWQPKVREKITRIIRRDRNIASETDKVTRLVITLDNKGALVKVQVISESGFRDLDDAAIEAFRAAAPFPNPPKGIIEADGTVKIRWDFIIES